MSEAFRFDTGELTIAGERWDGGPGAVDVLLLHGGGQTRHSWDRSAQRLARPGRTIITLDARGHGDSDWSDEGDYALEAFVRDVVAFCTTLDSTPIFVGASLGGTTALVAAGEHPGLASGLVLVDIVVSTEPSGVKRIHEFMNAGQDGFETLEEVADAIAAYNPNRKRTRNLEGLKKNVRRRDDGRWYWHWDPRFIVLRDEPHRQYDPVRRREAARKLEIPVLIVRGARSDVVSDAGVAEALELMPQARVIDVGRAGHMVAGDDNDVFAENLEAFLDELE